MIIGKLIRAAFDITGALLPLIVGVAGTEYWEHRAAGQPKWANINVHVLGWDIFHWAPPPSLAAQRDTFKIEYVQAKANVIVLTRAVGVQNAAVKANAAQSVRAMATSEYAVQSYRRAAANAFNHTCTINAPLSGNGVCERVQNIDDTFVSTLGEPQ